MIPIHTLATIENYVKDGIPPGHFVRAVLENNLMESFSRADLENRHAMFDIAVYVYNEIPHNCWGSKKVVDAWIEAKQKQQEEQANVQAKTND